MNIYQLSAIIKFPKKVVLMRRNNLFKDIKSNPVMWLVIRKHRLHLEITLSSLVSKKGPWKQVEQVVKGANLL